jgi:hypothetical protein
MFTPFGGGEVGRERSSHDSSYMPQIYTNATGVQHRLSVTAVAIVTCSSVVIGAVIAVATALRVAVTLVLVLLFVSYLPVQLLAATGGVRYIHTITCIHADYWCLAVHVSVIHTYSTLA